MAAQCRSPRCTAERKGFRRELDSWRHRLIHCVGFESILEGLYGPGLRRDLSLFDDCEPEELVDWCVDEKCSLCSLHKETVDCTPSAGSAQSTPTGEVISQGQFNTEKIECQAENYLNALFQKKDLPRNCDPNIPLVAQELMKKMIRQFAIEYVSKSRKMYQDNGKMVDSPFGCNGIQLNQTEKLQEEQDSPLDLTVTRIQEHSFQDEDGVLDLSLKRNGSRLEENSKIKNLKLDVINGYFLRKLKKATKLPKQNSALSNVLATYCLYHQKQFVLMLKFLREEQKTCSQVCCGHLQVTEQAKSSKRTKKTPAVFNSCTKEKLSNCVTLKKQVSSANLPYLSVRLKDLRLTWPNLALGTVKLNPIKHGDLHLTSNDKVLHCINTRSKKKKLFIHCSSRYRAISCSSSLPRLKLQRVGTCLDGTIVKSDLKYCNKPSPVSIKNKSCQTEGTHKTVSKSSNAKDPSCGIDGKQNNLMPTENNATQSSQDKCKIGSVHFGNLIKHLLNSSKTNHFVELLNQDTKKLENTGIQTRFQKNQQKSPIFGCSLPSSQSLEFTSKLNFCDTFPKEKNGYEKDLQKSTENMANPVGSKKQKVCDILVTKDTENTPTESVAQKNKTELPHRKSRIHSKNVSCVKNSQPCLPEVSIFSGTENVNIHKRRSRQDSFFECNIPLKRYSKNILGKCKLCDVSHGQCSFPGNRNLFCKCTIKHNSGILKNFKSDALLGRNTTDKTRNAHLKVVVERLENTIGSGAQIPERSKKENCETREIMVNQGARLELPSDQLSINPLTSDRSSNYLSLRSATRKNQGDLTLSSKSITHNSASCRITGNTYLSPIKLMFISKIESEDGEKYALSPVYTPHNNNKDHHPMAALRKQSIDAQSKDIMDDCLSQSGNPSKFHNSKCKVITSSSPSEAYVTTHSHHKDVYTVRKKLLGSNRVGHHILRNVGKPTVKQSRSKNLDKEMPVKMKNDLKISIPYKANKIVTRSKLVDHLRETRTTETYIAKNISSTQIKIKKLHKILESPVSSDFTNVVLPGEHTVPLESENCKISLRISSRLQKLKKPSTFPNLCVVNECSSEQKKTKHKINSDVQRENSKKAYNMGKCQAEQDLNQKTPPGKHKILKSRLIRKQALSNYMTRSKKSPLFALYYGSQSKFSVRCALFHKSKKHSFGKSKHYRKKLRSYKQQCKPPLIHLNSVDNENQSLCTSVDPDLQADTAIEWWSATTSNETLLNHLESRYEHIAKTWVTENNVENDSETQLSPVWKFSSSESRSPIQMLFQKKCDKNDLATWFMQTTETQSLSIVRKANARKPEKGSRRKTKQSVNSSVSKKYLKKCRQLTQSCTLEELHPVSKFVHPESFSLNISKHKRKSSSDKTKDVSVKFSCADENLNQKAFCRTKVNAAESTVKETVQLTKDDPKASTSLGMVQVSSPPSPAESRVQISSNTNMKALKENEPKCSTRCQNSELSIKDCKVFLTKCESKETKMLLSNEVSSDGNSKYIVKSGLGLNAGFSTKYRLQVGKTLIKRRCFKKVNTLNCRYEMCLRKLRGTVQRDSHCNTSVLQKRKKHMKVALYLEKNKNRPKEQRSVTGKVHTDYTKLQIGPLKPVGFPATRGLLSKFGSYSLTPIRIPLK